MLERWLIFGPLLLVVPVALAVAVWWLQARQCTRDLGLPDGLAEASFAGGFRMASAERSSPWARLEFFDWGVRAWCRLRVARALTPRWEARYSELTVARPVTGPLGGRGVWLRADGAAGPLIFWTRRGPAVLDLLEMHDVPVDRAGKRMRLPEDLEQRPADALPGARPDQASP
jgi:hypothetical protein